MRSTRDFITAMLPGHRWIPEVPEVGLAITCMHVFGICFNDNYIESITSLWCTATDINREQNQFPHCPDMFPYLRVHYGFFLRVAGQDVILSVNPTNRRVATCLKRRSIFDMISSQNQVTKLHKDMSFLLHLYASKSSQRPIGFLIRGPTVQPMAWGGWMKLGDPAGEQLTIHEATVYHRHQGTIGVN